MIWMRMMMVSMQAESSKIKITSGYRTIFIHYQVFDIIEKVWKWEREAFDIILYFFFVCFFLCSKHAFIHKYCLKSLSLSISLTYRYMCLHTFWIYISVWIKLWTENNFMYHKLWLLLHTIYFKSFRLGENS